MIFAMPPAEAAFHDSDSNDKHELYLMCDDIVATLKDLQSKKVKVSDVNERRWGKLATFTLPGGGKIQASTSQPIPVQFIPSIERLTIWLLECTTSVASDQWPVAIREWICLTDH